MKRKLKHQGICQDRERRSSINHLPDEVILEIFDFYRRGRGICFYESYDQRWREKHAWIRLTHVCRKWRAIAFASTSRLDLGITIAIWKPSHIKTILSGSWPIFIKYGQIYVGINIGSALWRLRATLKHRDRIREISFQGMSAEFDRFFEDAQRAFPILESLTLSFKQDYNPNLPDTFLGGPDSYNLHLRRLKLEHTTLASISDFILAATALTDLSLQIDAAFSPSAEVSLLACLQGMPCLCRLDLSLIHKSPSRPPTPKNIVQLSKLTYFHFFGSSEDLDALVAGLSAPSLQDVDFKFYDEIWSPNLHLRRFNDEIEKHYHAVFMSFDQNKVKFSSITHSEYKKLYNVNNDLCDPPRFNFGPVWNHHLGSIIQMSDALSTMLSTVEELRVLMYNTHVEFWEDLFPWRRFLRSFSSIKVFQIEGENGYFGRTLSKESDTDLCFLPALKEIKLIKDRLDECEAELATFQPFVNARQKGGFPVKVFFVDE